MPSIPHPPPRTAPVNHPPSVVGPSYSTPRDRAVAAPSLLASATDADGDTLTLVGHSQPAYGTLTVAPDGSFVYVPFDFVGPSSRADSFAFNVSDGQGGITQGVVAFTISELPG
jgi:large repetitive protein